MASTFRLGMIAALTVAAGAAAGPALAQSWNPGWGHYGYRPMPAQPYPGVVYGAPGGYGYSYGYVVTPGQAYGYGPYDGYDRGGRYGWSDGYRYGRSQRWSYGYSGYDSGWRGDSRHDRPRYDDDRRHDRWDYPRPCNCDWDRRRR